MDNIRPICQACHNSPAAINYIKKGKVHYRSRCGICIRRDKPITPKKPDWSLGGYKKKPHCEKCGFKAKYKEQLSIFYVDGNLKNNSIVNLKTICANCQIALTKEGSKWTQGDLIPDF